MEVVVYHSRKSNLLLFLTLAFLLSWAACAEDDNNDGNTGGTDTDTGTDQDGGPPPAKWSFEKIDEENMGMQSHIAVGLDGSVAIAYFSTIAHEDGICEEVDVNPPPRLRHTLRFAARAPGASTWTTETVSQPVFPLGPTGLDLAFNSLGQATIAFTGGDPQMQFCGSNDAIVATRTDTEWTFATAGAESGESATGEPASDAGFVVGLWPALAFDADGNPAVLHKDVHFGGLQHDDKYRADAELAWNTGGGWTHEAVDFGDGAGNSGTLIFDGTGRPIAIYAITIEAQRASRHGVWAARRETDGTWNKVKLHTGMIHKETTAAFDPGTGELVVAFYSASDSAVKVRRLTDPELFAETDAWDSELVGDSRYDEGQNVSLAFTNSGKAVLAYHRCKLYTSDASGCDINDEAVILAVQDGSDWDIEVVKQATVGSCGNFTSLAIDAAGNAHISYSCAEEIDGKYVFRLFAASKSLGGHK
jgi:hypothetical protein